MAKTLYKGFEAVVGLEVHLQLNTQSKMFSSVNADYFGAAPNSHTDVLTLGLPGTLPQINQRAVEHALMFGLALHCDVEGFTQFHRKNYFYPDSPFNYQISQYDRPIARSGWLEVNGRRIRINRAHLENDAGKNLHPDGADYSYLDLNRAGCALIEMVTEADIESGEEARSFLEQVQAIAQALGISDASPEAGKMRCDLNVSVRRPGEAWGTKCEVKNLNSFRNVERALSYETERQVEAILAGKRITQDTLGWNEGGGRTFVMRTKEGEADYRYFPDPDLPPLNIDAAWIARVQAAMPKLPAQKQSDYQARGLRERDAQVIAHNVDLSRFFEAALTRASNSTQNLANWLTGDVLGWLGSQELSIKDSLLKPEHLAGLVEMIDNGTISGKIAKDILAEVMQGHDPAEIVEARGLKQTSDSGAIEAAIAKIIGEKPDVVAQVQAGNAKAANALFGPIMKATGGTAKPELVRELLNKALGIG
jgi:aspartyl-tRNA(Asn)/glutamyl-tRNA(Gln) amidotransferase subunit B